MRWPFVFLLAMAGMCAVQATRADEAKPCQLIRIDSLPMETLMDGRPSIPVTLQGRQMSFLLDTAGVIATVNWDEIADLGLKATKSDRLYLIGVAGSELTKYVRSSDFGIGRVHGSDVYLYLETRGARNFDGTIAPDMLRKFDVDLDFAHGKLNLFSQDHCDGGVVYWTRNYAVLPMDVESNGHIRVPVFLDGKKIMATIDSGSDMTFMTVWAARTVDVDPKSPDFKIKVPDKNYPQYSYPFHTLDFQGVRVNNPHIQIFSNSFTRGMDNDITIGANVLRQLHIYIAYKERNIYVTPALAH